MIPVAIIIPERQLEFEQREGSMTALESEGGKPTSRRCFNGGKAHGALKTGAPRDELNH